MTLQQARYVVEIARNNSMNKAAQALFITQPTLSEAVRELETELGIRIFERTRKGVTLTLDGIEFLRLCENLLDQADTIEQRYSRKESCAPNRLQISTQHYSFVVDAFIAFLRENINRRYRYSLNETRTLSVIEEVYSRKSALGLLFETSGNKRILSQILEKWNLDFHTLEQVLPRVFLRRTHPLACCDRLGAEDLAPYPMLVFAQESGSHPLLAEEIYQIPNPDKVIYVQDRGTMNNIIACTDSFNIGTGYIVPGIIPDEIVSVALADIREPIKIGWIYPHGREVPPEIQRFLGLIQESLSRNRPGV